MKRKRYFSKKFWNFIVTVARPIGQLSICSSKATLLTPEPNWYEEYSHCVSYWGPYSTRQTLVCLYWSALLVTNISMNWWVSAFCNDSPYSLLKRQFSFIANISDVPFHWLKVSYSNCRRLFLQVFQLLLQEFQLLLQECQALYETSTNMLERK